MIGTRLFLFGLAALLLSGADAATLTVTGDIPMPLALTPDDLAKMPRVTVSVAEPDGTTVNYEGIPVQEILKKAGAPSGNDLRGNALASYVVAKAQDGYQVVFALAELDPELSAARIIVADRRGGKPLPARQGPRRIVCTTDKETCAERANARSDRDRALAEVGFWLSLL